MIPDNHEGGDLMSRKDRLLTTTDNPYNPFIEWRKWYMWDVTHGYNTCGLLDRVAMVPETLGADVEMEAIHFAMMTIVRENLSGHHTLIFRGEELSSVMETSST